MVPEERIMQLEAFVKIWKEGLARAEEQLTNLLKAKEMGILVQDDDGNDMIPDRIMQEDLAVRTYHSGLIRAESLLGRAQHGENV